MTLIATHPVMRSCVLPLALASLPVVCLAQIDRLWPIVDSCVPSGATCDVTNL
jgi:hypothetical protein